MSRVGNQPIVVPNGVVVEIQEGELLISGPKGRLSVSYPECVKIVRSSECLKVSVDVMSRVPKALHGLYRSLVQNSVTGVLVGFERRLELNGVGYQCVIKSGKLELSVGFSKPVVFDVPSGISCVTTDSTHLTVSGVDKQAVGQFAAHIRGARVPDPYKAKGVKYQGEFIRRKAGKAFGSGS